MKNNARFTAVIAFLVIALNSCGTSPVRESATTAVQKIPERATVNSHETSGPILLGKEGGDVAAREIYAGTGNFINRQAAAPRNSEPVTGDVTLNFQSTEIGEVVKTVLGDILNVNYSFDDSITGTISMRTTQPIAREALLPTLENLLRMNGAALINNGHYYEVLSATDKLPSGLRPGTSLDPTQGMQIVIVPLRYVGAQEMQRILEPVKSPKSSIVVDAYRNILLLAGTHSELTNLRETINIFDVDQLQGMSVGLFRLEYVDAATIVEELGSVFGDNSDGPLAGVFRFTVIERLNAVLVVTAQKNYLQSAETWIRRLDQAENIHGTNMYVYYVQNGKAKALADTLTELFEGKRRAALSQSERSRAAVPTKTTTKEQPARAANGRRNEQVSSLEVGDVTIIADAENNALLVLGSASDYAEIEKAIKKLDVLPMQVLVEASIVEVSLDEELEYGLQWFFKDGHGKLTGRGGLNIPPDGDIGATLPGLLNPADFTYAVFDASGTRAVLNAAAGDSRLNVLSSPSLMVLDNQTATIRVGDQVPIRTSESTNTNSDNFNVTSQIQYRDTGVTLEVTPRVNAGGMVVLDLTQRVDDVDQTDTSGIDSPTIIQREIQTSVAVQSGETIVLGGLIRENKQKADQGVPFLKDIPGVGLLFSSRRKLTSKTELVVMITPTAIANSDDARAVTNEYRNKLKDVDFSDLLK